MGWESSSTFKKGVRERNGTFEHKIDTLNETRLHILIRMVVRIND